MFYEIIYAPIIINGIVIPKYNVKYTGGEYAGLVEFHSIDGVNGTTRINYIKK